MRYIQIVILVFAYMLTSCNSGDKEKLKESLPNILFIYADDLGHGDLGVYNPLSKIPTPNLDQLAMDGIRFSDAYCPVSVCSPSRYALMTGEYPWRSWKKSGVMANYEPSMIDEGKLTLPQMLQNAGYQTVGFGKWHLGTTFPTKDGETPVGYGRFQDDQNGANIDVTKPVSDGPLDRGFNRWLGFSCASECWIFEDNHIVGALVHDLYTIEAASGTEHLEKIPLQGFLPYITEKSIDYLQQFKEEETDNPFFLYYSPYVPHIPLAVDQDFIGKTDAGLYGDYVFELDHYIGQLIDELDRLGLKDNTIIIFASDNGSQFIATSPEGDNEQATNSPQDVEKVINPDAHQPNFPFKGTKWSVHEGGVRTPLIVSWAGKFPKGQVSNQLIALNDILPTLAGLVGESLPDGTARDGHNLLSAFYGNNVTAGKRESVVVRGSGNVYGLRQGNWKVVGEYPFVSPVELYNLKEDPGETINLALKNPEIAEKLLKLLNDHLNSAI
ncbi:sulfatase family protein [Cyclobacterium qasimii]|uniref:Arylsulfatase n=1 Tax=Cyclobacterium qasimii TaxID=1350429 RepID=A0A512C8P5_9BACT|nr:arylsulfatase [Cyclobacterium qasimii]GEO20540.1 arylsulfatase [Cyclobacterium qasimii]